MSTSKVRLVTLDLDNTLWRTGATIAAANAALAAHLHPHTVSTTIRVETVMGQLFQANKARYCPIDLEQGHSPVLLTLLRKDAIRHVLELAHHDATTLNTNTTNDDDHDAIVEAAFDVWTKARYASILNHLALNVPQSLEQIRTIASSTTTTNIVVGAITDGNSNPLQIPELAAYFDFCVNAESIGIAKPDRRVYLYALRQALQYDSLHDLVPAATSVHSITDDELEEMAGPWWVHIGDDFVKDIVAAKNLNLRSIWARELVLDKLTVEDQRTPSSARADDATTKPRTVQDLVQTVGGMKIIEMSIGADDYLAESLQSEFADAIVDQFGDIPEILNQWQVEAGRFVGDETRRTRVLSNAATRTLTNGTDEPKAKFCINCGEKLPVVAKFCSGCGERQNDP
jgi:FMN phosphatase YigB (HAD superfamily)